MFIVQYGFAIYTLMPRTLVTLESMVGSISSSSVLVVEEDKASDPLDFLVGAVVCLYWEVGVGDF